MQRPAKHFHKFRGPTALYFVIIFAALGFAYLAFSNAATNKSRGDINNDGIVDMLDIRQLIGKFSGTDVASDVNGDGRVTVRDLSVMLSNYKKPVVNTPPPFQVIYLSKLVPDSNAIAEYKTIQSNPNVAPSFRADSVSEYQKWEKQGYNYYYMAASSDYTTCSTAPNPYQADANVENALAGKYNSGIYLHEFAAIYACGVTNWNWPKAVQRIDWPRVDRWVMSAKAKGKKVVWAEPAAGWNGLPNDPTADSYFKKWGNTLVPVFATNYSKAPTNKVPEARAYALAAAQKYNIEFGESIQSWYWIDPNWPYTSADARVLSEYGYKAGATYFEIEGTSGDMSPGTTYMNGVNEFIKGLGPTALPKQSGSGAPLPTYH